MKIKVNIQINDCGKKIAVIEAWRDVVGRDLTHGSLTAAKDFIEARQADYNNGIWFTCYMSDAQFGRFVAHSVTDCNGYYEPNFYWSELTIVDDNVVDFTL